MARVAEIKRRLDGTEARFDCEGLVVEPGRRAILLYVLDREWDVPGVSLRPGMRTYAHFWIDRPYNIYHWLDGERTVAHYVNVGECDEIERDRVVWRDYALDLLITPDGAVRVLDEDELRSADAATRALVAVTRAQILANPNALVGEVERATRRVLDTRRAR